MTRSNTDTKRAGPRRVSEVQAPSLGDSRSQEIVVALSNRLAQARDDEVSSVIDDGLRILATDLGLERAFLTLHCEDLLYVVNSWIDPSLDPEQASYVAEIDPSLVTLARMALNGEAVAISSSAEFPPGADFEREYFEQRGMKSTLFVPGRIGEEVLGVLILDSYTESQSWGHEITGRLSLVVDLLIGAVLRRNQKREIRDLRSFESLAAELCASLAAVGADELETATDTTLERLGTFLGAERVFCFRFDTHSGGLTKSNLWGESGVDLDSPIFELDLAKEIPWVAQQVREGGIIKAGPGLSGLPEEARMLREQLERDGITTGLTVPMLVGGQAVGFLGLDTTGKPFHCSDSVCQRLQLIADVLGTTLVRTRSEVEIRRLSRFDRLITRLSTSFVNLSSVDVDSSIEGALGELGQCLNMDLGNLVQLDPETSVVRVTHEWREEGLDPALSFEGVAINDQTFPWLASSLSRSDAIQISRLEDFPEEAQVERKTCEDLGIRSVLWVPYTVSEELRGYVVFYCTHFEVVWSEDLVGQIRQAGEVFGNALERARADRELARLKSRLESDNRCLRTEVSSQSSPDDIVGNSRVLQEVLEQGLQVAVTNSTVLILGETGTGKELLARYIHKQSSRSDRPLVKVNCGALPATLVEAELFGHERGAYTGALNKQVGRFEIADGSSILLDEIGDLPLEIQVKLLRVLQDGEIERLGSSKTIKIDVRVLAATNRNLEEAVREGRFRSDLYYRLNVFPLTLPPLRERPEDVPDLIWRFIREFVQSMGKSIETVPRKTMRDLTRRAWPGNVRELRNVIERAMILSPGPELLVPIPSEQSSPIEGGAHSTLLDDVQRRHILDILERTRWRLRGKRGAADLLGLKPSTLEYRMKKLDIVRPK